MEDLESKVLSELTTLGCTSGKQRILCYLLYVYLLEKVRLHDLKCAYSESIKTPYLLGRRSLKESAIYVALPAGTPLSITQLEEFHQLCDDSYPTLHLGFIDGDSTTVLYSVTPGLMDPKDPEGLLGRKKREERRNMVDSKIQGKRDQIIECALKCGVQDETAS